MDERGVGLITVAGGWVGFEHRRPRGVHSCRCDGTHLSGARPGHADLHRRRCRVARRGRRHRSVRHRRGPVRPAGPVLREARPQDALSLWHLVDRVDPSLGRPSWIGCRRWCRCRPVSRARASSPATARCATRGGAPSASARPIGGAPGARSGILDLTQRQRLGPCGPSAPVAAFEQLRRPASASAFGVNTLQPRRPPCIGHSFLQEVTCPECHPLLVFSGSPRCSSRRPCRRSPVHRSSAIRSTSARRSRCPSAAPAKAGAAGRPRCRPTTRRNSSTTHWRCSRRRRR